MCAHNNHHIRLPRHTNYISMAIPQLLRVSRLYAKCRHFYPGNGATTTTFFSSSASNPHLSSSTCPHTHDARDPHSLSSRVAINQTASPPPSTIHFTKVTTWNIDRQASYDGPIKACVHGDLDFLHCTEPVEHMTPGTRATATLINTANKTGYVLYITTHCHTYIRQATLHTRLISLRSSYNGRLYTFVFQGSNMHHTAILCLYAFQRGHRDHSTATAENETNTAQSSMLFK